MTLVETPYDLLDRAYQSEADDMARRLAANAANATHHYVILFYRDGETVEDRFDGTKDERLGHMADTVIERGGETIQPLGIDLDTHPWAAGFYDPGTMEWKVCGNNIALKHLLQTRPRPYKS